MKVGTGGPASVGLNTSLTRWPIRMASRLQSTRLVIIVTPSSSVTYAMAYRTSARRITLLE